MHGRFGRMMNNDIWEDGPNYPPLNNPMNNDFGGPGPRNFRFGGRPRDEDAWDVEPNFGPMNEDFRGPGPSPRGYRNDLYNNAYGDYRGGYAPSGGPPPLFGPRNFSGPPNAPPTFVLGRGFGPDGPPLRRTAMDERVIKYLLRCGVAKEHLKNLPRDLLQLIEPEHCGLCAQSFESFAISRMHYISKNHLKNQKKWLTQQTDTAFATGPRELPLKSRDLYCELCDVHITSKTHAESHYAGRPHRSIVEGRKVPRNPFLLQPGMERRLEQLIRREKKSLKAVDDTIEPEEVKQENKPVQPELYCEICKTSVTCSEQMTMHLNGKRHLSKEKQHILKMMKGNANGNENEEDYEDYEEEEEEGEGEDEGEGDGGEEGTGNNVKKEEDNGDAANDDWANGSGNWDEPATVKKVEH